VFLLISTLLILGGVEQAIAEKPKYGGHLTIGVTLDITNFDPTFHRSGGDKWFLYNLYDYATMWVPVDEEKWPRGGVKYAPQMAESWEWEDDTHLVMKFRKGIKFHDGTELNAEVVKFYYDRVLDPKVKSNRYGEVIPLKNVEIIDDYSLRFVLKKMDAIWWPFTYWTGMYPSPTAIKKYGDQYGRHPAGTGPFMLVEQAAGVEYKYKKFPDYWQKGLPYLDGYTVRVIPDQAVLAAAVKAGEIDFTQSLAAKDASKFMKDPKYKTIRRGPSGMYLVYLNSANPPTNNIHVRKALSYAINRKEILARFYGLAYELPGHLQLGGWASNPDQTPQQYDLEKAKEELKLAGMPKGFKAKVLQYSSPIVMETGEQLKEMWRKIGVNVQLETVEVAVVAQRHHKGEFRIYNGGWGGAHPDYDNYHMYHPKGTYNLNRHNDPEVTALIEKARMTRDINERVKIYWEVQRHCNEKVLDIYMVGGVYTYVMKPKVMGWTGAYWKQYQAKEIWLAR
jgi:peptide/nickel transport system substrate-binding protein